MTRYIPKKLYKPVWMDNHAFMLENHMYNDDYLTFVADICKTIKLPEDYTCIQATEGVCSHDYYRGYETLGKAEEESYMWALDTLYKHYYDVAIHCFDTEVRAPLPPSSTPQSLQGLPRLPPLLRAACSAPPQTPDGGKKNRVPLPRAG